MKIENDHPPQGAKAKAPSPTPANQRPFQAVFEQSLQEVSSGNRTSKALSVTRPPAATAMSIGPLSSDRAAVKSFEDLLGALAIYQERLGDGRVSLRMLESDLNRVDEQCRQLDGLARNLPSGGDLLAVLQEGLATARMEMERFQRGDYC